MKKQVLITALIMAAAISFAACGKKDGKEKETTPVPTTTIDSNSKESTKSTEETSTGDKEAMTIPGGVVADGVYTSPDGVMSFTLPKGFSKVDRDDVIDFVSADYPMKADNLHFTTTENSGGLTFFTKDILESVYADNSAYEKVSVTEIEALKIAGQPAVKATMTFVLNGVDVTQTQLYIEAGELIYHLYYSKISDLSVDFDSCIKSIVFHNV